MPYPFETQQGDLDPAERKAREERARLLREQGWGSIQDWLMAPELHPGERAHRQERPLFNPEDLAF